MRQFRKLGRKIGTHKNHLKHAIHIEYKEICEKYNKAIKYSIISGTTGMIGLRKDWNLTSEQLISCHDHTILLFFVCTIWVNHMTDNISLEFLGLFLFCYHVTHCYRDSIFAHFCPFSKSLSLDKAAAARNPHPLHNVNLSLGLDKIVNLESPKV